MQNSFFDQNSEKRLKEKSPLAERMRPKSLDAFIGQVSVIGEGSQLNRMIKADKIFSMILFGPPGSGKTAIANIIAENTKSEFIRLNATNSGASDIRDVARDAKSRLGFSGKSTILFVDEIHRFNKAQQDALLPIVENGTIALVGATTENPYFEVNAALVSRSHIFRLEKLTEADIKMIISNALADKENGLGNYSVELTNEAENFLSLICDGDARVALNTLELAFLSSNPSVGSSLLITRELVESCIQKKAVLYDKAGEGHYDTISAFIKSLRGSDPDAALYWMAKMLYAGEDPKFIARRMVIFASEDVGNAEPHALPLAIACYQAVEIIGLPECKLNLAQCATFLASCPKSNASSEALGRALKDIENRPIAQIPVHLRSGGGTFGNGEGYLYPHLFPKHYVKQAYLPEDFMHEQYYEPSDQGYEKRIGQFLEWVRGSEESHN